ncbi:hypothetical protein GF389_05425 [Candidatus Dojkabacteria bacterium]|nr:hypothetical protein [Candidatus Dojkabacteria bacterium]
MQISFVYRFDLIGYLLVELIAISGIVILWFTIYRDQGNIEGLTLEDISLYYFFLPLIGTFTMVEVSRALGYHIKDGFLSYMLLHPIKVSGVYVSNDLGRKIYPILTTSIIYVLIMLLLHFSFDFDSGIELQGVFFMGIFILLALILHYVFDLAVAYLAFWVDDVWGFAHFKFLAFSVLGGLSFPFELVGGEFRWVLELLPFKYMYYVPVSYLLGKRAEDDLWFDLIIWSIWLALISILAYFIWKRGIKKYAAYGN